MTIKTSNRVVPLTSEAYVSIYIDLDHITFDMPDMRKIRLPPHKRVSSRRTRREMMQNIMETALGMIN